MSIALVTVALTISASGCSSESKVTGSDPGWQDGAQVIEGVTESGFDCSEDSISGTKQIITENPATKEPLGGELVLCGGFQVFLVGAIDDYWDSLSSSCSTVTPEELSSEAVQRSVVVGSNFVMSGTGPDQAFPDGASADDLARAFGSQVRTLKSIYEEVCPNLDAA